MHGAIRQPQKLCAWFGNRIFEQDFPSADANSLALIAEIERIGLEPFQAPEPLPPIQPEDVTLICWMALESV